MTNCVDMLPTCKAKIELFPMKQIAAGGEITCEGHCVLWLQPKNAGEWATLLTKSKGKYCL